MITRRIHHLLLGLLIGLCAAAPSAAGDCNDPRAEQMALAIGYSMSNQQDKLAEIPSIAKTKSLVALRGTIRDGDFYLAGAYVRTFEIENASGRMTGLLFHRDVLSRMMMTRFESAFTIGAALAIKDVDVTPTYTSNTRSALFFVPAERVPAAGFNGLPFKEALLKANQNAIPPEGEGQADLKPRAYTVVAFMMDRQPPGVQMEMAMGNAPDSAPGALCQRGPNQDGWCFAVFPATFAYNQGKEAFFNIFLREADTVWLVNTYSSHSLLKRIQTALKQRGYDPGPADGMMGAKTRQAIQLFQKQQGIAVDGRPSIALLSLLKNPTPLPTIELVQASLKTLGYDPGPVDGRMGGQTLTALRKYQAACGLTPDGVLSAGLLCRMTDTAYRMPGGLSTFQERPGAKANRFESRMWPNQLAKP
jgi:peptidoglycan hydrolase-like protein with peptidoglycan-binding domain